MKQDFAWAQQAKKPLKDMHILVLINVGNLTLLLDGHLSHLRISLISKACMWGFIYSV